MENIYLNKGSPSGNNRNEDKASTILTTVSQQGAELLNSGTLGPQSPDQSGWHLYYTISVNNE